MISDDLKRCVCRCAIDETRNGVAFGGNGPNAYAAAVCS
jgi:hypothetical protein